MKKIQIFLLGTVPTPLKRHRTVRRNGFMFSYDPNAKAKQHFLAQAKRVAIENGNSFSGQPIQTPFKTTARFVFQYPKNFYKKNGELKNVYKKPTRCDIDNLLKFIFDACSGVFFKDDRLCVEVFASKSYGENYGVFIEFYEVE